MLVQPGKYKRDANLGSGGRVPCRFLSTRTLRPLLKPNRCVRVYYWREPKPSCPPFSFLSGVSRAALCARSCTISRGRVFGTRFNLPRRECVDTGKYSPATRSHMLGWRMAKSSWKGSSKGNSARGSAGKSAEADETTFFLLPPFLPRFPFATCTSPFFLCTRSRSCLKLSTVCLAYMRIKRRDSRLTEPKHRRMKKIGATNHPWKWTWRRIGWMR